MSEPRLRNVGWGPFRLPWERKRRQQSYDEVRRLFERAATEKDQPSEHPEDPPGPLTDEAPSASEARVTTAAPPSDAGGEPPSPSPESPSSSVPRSGRADVVAQKQTEAERQQAIVTLRSEVGRLSTDLASRIVGESLHEETRQKGITTSWDAEGKPTFTVVELKTGRPIGTARTVWLDDETGKPAWAAVVDSHDADLWTFTSSALLPAPIIPLQDALLERGVLRIPYSADKVMHAPRVFPGQFDLSEDLERRAYEYYGLRGIYQTFIHRALFNRMTVDQINLSPDDLIGEENSPESRKSYPAE